jgi:hypothetical protein
MLVFLNLPTPSANISVSSISAMATSKHTDQVEIAASVIHNQGRKISETLGTFCDYLLCFDLEPDLDLLSSSVNVSPRVRTTSSPERPLNIPTEIIDSNQLQGATTVSQHEDPLETTTQYTLHHQPIIPYLELMPKGTEFTSFEDSSTPGTQLESSAVSISEHDLSYELPPHGNVSIQEDTRSHQPTPLENTGEPHGIANIFSSAAPAATSEQSSRKGLLKGKTWFCFAFSPTLTLQIRYFP